MSLAVAASAVAFGTALRHLGYVTERDGRSLCVIIFSSTLPAVMARTFATARMDASARCVALAGCAFGCACVLVSLTTTRAMRGANARSSGDALIEMSRRSREALVSGAAVGLNLGNFAYPLAEILYGAKALELIVVFDATNQVFLLIVAHAIYTWRCSKIDVDGAGEAAKDGSTTKILESMRRSMVKQARNPCLLACFVTLCYRAVWGDGGFPPAIDGFLAFLAGANKPAALLALGILFQPNMARDEARDMVCALARRYGASMLCASAVLYTMGGTLGSIGSAVALMAMLSPLPLLTVTYAMEFALNVPFAATLVNYANLVSGAMIAVLAHVSFANPVALAPNLAAFGAATLGFGALVRRADRSAGGATKRASGVIASCFDPRRSMRVGIDARRPAIRARGDRARTCGVSVVARAQSPSNRAARSRGVASATHIASVRLGALLRPVLV